MFSTAQLDMMNAVLNSHASEIMRGELYYIAYTTNTTDNDPDLQIALSNKPITTNDGYTFYFESDNYELVSCYTSNYYSGNYYSGKRVFSSTVDTNILSINIREFISTNASPETFVCLDYSDRGVVQNEKIIKTNTALCFIFGVVLFTLVLSRFFDNIFRSR